VKRGSKSRSRRNDELVGQLHGFVKYLLHAHGDDFAKTVGELELSLTQLRALHVLAYEAEQASLGYLAEHLGVSLPAVSRSVENLVQRDLVTRAEDATDRRMKQVRVTPAGVALVERLAELRLAGIDEFVETLSGPERASLTAAMALLAKRDEIASRCAPRTKPLPSHRKDAA
jgi:DNA-binding MarR family transcriptional regulator